MYRRHAIIATLLIAAALLQSATAFAQGNAVCARGDRQEDLAVKAWSAQAGDPEVCERLAIEQEQKDLFAGIEPKMDRSLETKCADAHDVRGNGTSSY